MEEMKALHRVSLASESGALYISLMTRLPLGRSAVVVATVVLSSVLEGRDLENRGSTGVICMPSYSVRRKSLR